MILPAPINALLDEFSPVQYKTIDTTTRRGLNRANLLLSRGWKLVHAGEYSVQLYKPTTKQTHV